MDKRDVLVVVDMQKDFVDGTLGTEEAQAIVPTVVQRILSFDGLIVVTQDTHYVNYLNTHEGSFLPVEHCQYQSKGWELVPEVQEALKDREGVVYITKETFGSLELPEVIKKETADFAEPELIIYFVGLCTDICVVSNALLVRAAIPEADIYVYENCCAGVTPEKHQAALETMRSCQIVVR